ncbi:MAG: hypothetical protein ACK56F_16400, partial [bacterium]
TDDRAEDDRRERQALVRSVGHGWPGCADRDNCGIRAPRACGRRRNRETRPSGRFAGKRAL